MPERPTVLVVDDDPDTVEFVRGVLESEFAILEAGNGAEALEVLAGTPGVTAIVSDHAMPGMTGVQVLAKSLATHPHAARILFTATDRVDELQGAVNIARVRRFLSKPTRPAEILGAVRDAVREARLEQENERLVAQLSKALGEIQASERKLQEEVSRKTRELVDAVAKLEELALRDGLTGLFNHRYFQDALTAELARSTRYSRELSLIFLDVDHFKNYNDMNGHPSGDHLLIRLAKILADTGDDGVPEVRIRGRASDIAARYGGEEFVVILPETPKAGAIIRAERIRQELERSDFEGREKQPGGKVTVSVGVASYPVHALTKVALIEAADQALLRAKRAGRNRVEVAPG